MGSTKDFWIFSDAFCFFGFFTQNLYNLIIFLNNMVAKSLAKIYFYILLLI